MISALHTKISNVAHTPSIGFDPQKYVGPNGWHVKSPTTSLMARLSISVNSLPIDFLDMCPLASRQTIKWSPSSHHFFSWATRSCEIAFLGDKISVVLLIRCAAIPLFVVAGVVAVHHSCLNSFTFQRHHQPLTKAGLVLTQLIMH
jgi:hypothetical protein